jgi:hypothetical protein
MAFAIKMANIFKAAQDSAAFKDLDLLKTVFDSEWTKFVVGELARSNDLNNRALGGRQRSKSDDDDDPTSRLDENMEEIMSRFNIVNNLISKSNDDNDDDEDKDEKHEEEPDTEDHLPAEDAKPQHAENEDAVNTNHRQLLVKEIWLTRIEVTLPESNQLDKEMTDSAYWKVNIVNESLDDLLADYE